MTDQAAAGQQRSPGLITGPMDVVRFLFADRLGLVLLIWLAFAFVLLPSLMDAHRGAPGVLADWWRSKFEALQIARFAGVTQWAALAGLMLVVALAHVRLATTHGALMQSARVRFGVGATYIVALVVGYVWLIWTPTTAVLLMLHDAFIFFDAIYRIDNGQVPSVDFPTPLGAAMLYLPWLGSKISGGYGGAIEMASAVVALGLGLVCAQACATRFPTSVSAVLIAAIFLITVPAMLEGYIAPDSVTLEGGELLNLGEEYALAMFYNRWGWGALIAMFAFLTPRPADAKTPVAEVAVLGLMLVFLFWLKLSYFVVGGAIAVLYAFLGQKPWRTLGIGAGVTAAGIVLVGLITGNLVAYIGDILTASKVSGGRVAGMLSLFKENFEDFLIALSPMVVLAFLRKIRAMDMWVCGLIFIGTLFTINQNAQSTGVPTMMVAGAYAIWRMRDEENRALKIIAAIALALPATGFILERSSGLLGQTVVARREEARPPPAWAGIPAMKGVYAQERESMLDLLVKADTEEKRLSTFRKMAVYGRRQYLRSAEYMATLMAGMDELKPVMGKAESVVVLDFNSPLAFLTQTRPAKGFWITFDDGRTISEDVAPEGKILFADADHVMMPRIFMEPDTATVLKMLYSDYLDGAYESRVETAYWVRWSHRKDASVSTMLAAAPAAPASVE